MNLHLSQKVEPILPIICVLQNQCLIPVASTSDSEAPDVMSALLL